MKINSTKENLGFELSDFHILTLRFNLFLLHFFSNSKLENKRIILDLAKEIRKSRYNFDKEILTQDNAISNMISESENEEIKRFLVLLKFSPNTIK